tara:strand:- start:156 stop:830 length:675 start_codon:yes stop_codon:yes gene_type:complete
MKNEILYRYELKFKIDWECKESFKNLLKMSLYNFEIAHPPRFVNNIYFDTENFKNYFDNINGNYLRKKIRIRWYGKFFNKIHPKIEHKEKKGLLLKKTVTEFPSFTILKNTDLTPLIENFKNKNQIKNNIKASVINRYHREYYASRGNLIRITIDDKQCYSNPHNTFQPKRIYPFKEKIIIEIKFDPKYFKNINEVTNQLGLRICKNSKYVNSIDALKFNSRDN